MPLSAILLSDSRHSDFFTHSPRDSWEWGGRQEAFLYLLHLYYQQQIPHHDDGEDVDVDGSSGSGSSVNRHHYERHIRRFHNTTNTTTNTTATNTTTNTLVQVQPFTQNTSYPTAIQRLWRLCPEYPSHLLHAMEDTALCEMESLRKVMHYYQEEQKKQEQQKKEQQAPKRASKHKKYPRIYKTYRKQLRYLARLIDTIHDMLSIYVHMEGLATSLKEQRAYEHAMDLYDWYRGDDVGGIYENEKYDNHNQEVIDLTADDEDDGDDENGEHHEKENEHENEHHHHHHDAPADEETQEEDYHNNHFHQAEDIHHHQNKHQHSQEEYREEDARNNNHEQHHDDQEEDSGDEEDSHDTYNNRHFQEGLGEEDSQEHQDNDDNNNNANEDDSMASQRTVCDKRYENPEQRRQQLAAYNSTKKQKSNMKTRTSKKRKEERKVHFAEEHDILYYGDDEDSHSNHTSVTRKRQKIRLEDDNDNEEYNLVLAQFEQFYTNLDAHVPLLHKAQTKVARKVYHVQPLIAGINEDDDNSHSSDDSDNDNDEELFPHDPIVDLACNSDQVTLASPLPSDSASYDAVDEIFDQAYPPHPQTQEYRRRCNARIAIAAGWDLQRGTLDDQLKDPSASFPLVYPDGMDITEEECTEMKHLMDKQDLCITFSELYRLLRMPHKRQYVDALLCEIQELIHIKECIRQDLDKRPDRNPMRLYQKKRTYEIKVIEAYADVIRHVFEVPVTSKPKFEEKDIMLECLAFISGENVEEVDSDDDDSFVENQKRKGKDSDSKNKNKTKDSANNDMATIDLWDLLLGDIENKKPVPDSPVVDDTRAKASVDTKKEKKPKKAKKKEKDKKTKQKDKEKPKKKCQKYKNIPPGKEKKKKQKYKNIPLRDYIESTDVDEDEKKKAKPMTSGKSKTEKESSARETEENTASKSTGDTRNIDVDESSLAVRPEENKDSNSGPRQGQPESPTPVDNINDVFLGESIRKRKKRKATAFGLPERGEHPSARDFYDTNASARAKDVQQAVEEKPSPPAANKDEQAPPVDENPPDAPQKKRRTWRKRKHKSGMLRSRRPYESARAYEAHLRDPWSRPDEL